jgi:hypothetical protein
MNNPKAQVSVSKGMTAVITLVLWLATALIGMWEVLLVRETFFRIYASFAGFPLSDSAALQQAQQASGLGTWLVFILGIILVIAVIGSGEYYYRHFGQPASWKLFSRIAAVELAIALLALFI